jgi:hypothetical protein
MKVKRFFARAKVLLPCMALALGFARTGSAASPLIITNYHDLKTAVAGGVSIFASNANVTISGGASILQISNTVILNATTNLDGTTNTATINRASGTGPIFVVLPSGSLTLLNLTISGGLNTNGGAILNQAGGTLIISNCLFTGNSATNFAGVDGLNATSQGNINGGNGGDGLSAQGGAITSQGVLEVYYSIFDNNSVEGGNGGNGGNGIQSFAFGGNGGSGGSGGSAQGGAIVCSGPTNIIVASAFTANKCTAGSAGTAGTPATGAFSGNPGSGGTGGSSSGGAILASGLVCMTNCLFSQNSVVGGSTSRFGQPGGSATGGGLALTISTNTAFIENTTFNENSCLGGAGGGNSSLVFQPAGNGGAATGGGLASAANLTVVRNCTLATNTLTGGTAGVSTTTESNGVIGLTHGFDLARTAGTLQMAGSILSGGTNATTTNYSTLTITTYLTNTTPNDSGGLTDLGYNFSSDTSVALLAARGGILNTNPYLDTVLSEPGNTVVGLLGGSPGQTLAVLSGSPAIAAVPGIPGLTFPAYDQVYQPRSSPTTMGAYEANPLDLANATPPTITQPPSDAATNAGGTAVFQVSASATSATPGYQWQFDGTNLVDGGRISGARSNTLTIKSVTTNDMGSYSVLVGTSTLIAGGVISSDTNTLTVFVPVTIQVEPPKSVKPTPGAPLNLFVTASGAEPLSFQWYVNETNALSDGPEITGATTSNLTIYPLAPDNAGNYSVVVSNLYGSVTSSIVTLSIPRPTLTILPTLSGVLTSNVTIMGTAASQFTVTNVLWQLNSQTWADANLLSTTNWSADVNLQPGTNVFRAFSVDLLGQPSLTNRVTIFFTNFANLTLTTNGFGKITPVFSNTSLVEGRNYTITAVPRPGNLFSNWTGPFTTTNNPLTFELDSDTAWQANFVTNFFLPAAGTYNGLFSSTNGVAVPSAGLISGLILQTNGAFSGKLLLAGTNYPLAGRFDILGQAAVTAGAATAPGGLLQVRLSLEPAPANQITGTVSNTIWTATNLLAELAGPGLPSPQYTMLFSPPAAAPAASPPGDGYALASIRAGVVTLAGALADGTAFNETVTASATGDLPVCVNLYKNAGLLFGWVNLANAQAAPPTNLLTWINPSGASALYPGGFTNTLPVETAPWIAPAANIPAIPLTGGLLVVSNSGLVLTFDVAVSNNNALAKLGGLPTNSLTGSINPKTGLLSVTFGNGAGKATTAGLGAVLQSSNRAAGFVVTGASAGLITLQTNLASVAPVIFQQPATLNFASNANARFSVLAVGSPPLHYQWSQDGAPLSDGGHISGSATNQLNLAPAVLTDAGSYSVVVSNSYGSATSAVAVLAVPPPALALKPFLSSVTSPALTLQGTASGKFGVANVLWQLNGGPWTNAATANQWTNWSASLTLQPGTNMFRAYCLDPLGNPSAVQAAAIFYSTQSTITLSTSGPGTISPGFTGASLAVGRGYTVTAVPKPGSLFSNWNGSITSTANPLTFLMMSNMQLTANFVPNFFIPSVGIYNGLFSSSNGVAQESAGLLYDLVLKTNGAYTGKLYVAGTNFSLVGSFDIFGHATAGLGASNASGGQLLLDMTLQKAPTNQILGTVSSNAWTANLIAELAGNGLPSAQYTMLFSAWNAATNIPPGNGYALVTNHAGLVSFTGALADGIAFTPGVWTSAAGDVPVYASLYNNTGLLFGWINLTNMEAAPPANVLTWIKKQSGAATLYPAGFTNSLSLQGAPWTAPPANSPAISYPKGDLIITNISNTNLDLDFTVAVLGNNSLAKLGGAPPNLLTGSIVPATGWLKLNFGIGNGAATNQGFGAVLQDQNIAGGYFLTTTNAGAIILQPPQ